MDPAFSGPKLWVLSRGPGLGPESDRGPMQSAQALPSGLLSQCAPAVSVSTVRLGRFGPRPALVAAAALPSGHSPGTGTQVCLLSFPHTKRLFSCLSSQQPERSDLFPLRPPVPRPGPGFQGVSEAVG